MKHNSKKRKTIFFAFGIFLVILFNSSIGFCAQSIGKLSYISGDVYVYSSLKKSKAEIGREVFTGDRVKTSKNASVEINLNLGGVIHIKESGSLKLKSSSKGKSSLSLESGKLRCKLKKLGKNESFIIKTPTSSAGVRGTDWIQTSTGDSLVITGLVEVKSNIDIKNGKKGIMVSAGKQVKINKDGTVSKPKKIPEAELKRVKEIYFIQTAYTEIKDKSKSPQQVSDLYIAQMMGSASIKSPDLAFSKLAKPGIILNVKDKLNTDYNSRVFFKFQDSDGVIQLVNKCQVECISRRTLLVNEGKCQVNSKSPIEIKVPYAMIKSGNSEIQLSVNSDKSTLLIVTKGSAEVIQGKANKKVKEGESLSIEKNALNSSDHKIKGVKKKMRAIFDFTRDETQDKKPTKKSKKQSESKTEGDEKNGASDDNAEAGETVQAKDAKLVEGQADGEGEYRYASNNILILILILLGVIILVGMVIWYIRKNKKSVSSSTSALKQIEFEDDYEGEDVYVIRGNLTTNDGVLETTKITHITGNVEDGAVIDAKHKLIIRGSFQSAILKSTENVTINGGINGQSKARLEIKGDLHTNYISEASVKVDGSIDAVQSIHNSNVAANGMINIHKKNIIGGIVSSKMGIESFSIGSDFSGTEIRLGEDAQKVWSETFNLESDIQFKSEEETLNTDAKLRVKDEIVAAVIVQGDRKLNQENSVAGPVQTYYEKSSEGVIKLQGYEEK